MSSKLAARCYDVIVVGEIKNTVKTTHIFVSIALLAILAAATVFSAANLQFRDISTGEPTDIAWRPRFLPVPWRLNTSRAPQDAEAVIQSAFDRWENLTTSSISFKFNGTLNKSKFTFDFINEVTFKDTVGLPPGVLGFAPSTFFNQDTIVADGEDLDQDGDPDGFSSLTVPADADGDGDMDIPAGAYPAGTMLDADIFLSPDLTTDGTRGSYDLEAVAIHEIGHFHGLAHSPIRDSSPAIPGFNAEDNATMFPFADPNPGGIEQRSLAPDDIAASSFYYPDGSFFPNGSLPATNGGISGRIVHGSSGEGLQSVHVFAVDAATSSVMVGTFSDPDGYYTIPGLPPGDYFVCIEPLDSTEPFLDPLRYNDITSEDIITDFIVECYDEDESATDDPAARSAVSVVAGAYTTNIDIITTVSIDPTEPNNDSSEAVAIAIEAPPIEDTAIDPTDPHASDPDEDWFSFSGTEGVTIEADIDAQAIGSSLDSTLTLLDSDLNMLAFNDQFDGNDSRIILTLPADGNYFLKVEGFLGASRGRYLLRTSTVIPDPNEPNNKSSEATAITIDAPPLLNTAIRSVDANASTPDEDWFTFTATGGITIEADVDAREIGSVLDPTLELFDSQLKSLAFNDDADGLDSKITHTLPDSGSYFLVVKGFGGFSTGGYDLRISQVEAEPTSVLFKGGLAGPTDLAFNKDGNLFITLIDKGTVIECDHEGNTVRVFARKLEQPLSLAFSPTSGHLFVGESFTENVLEFDVNGDPLGVFVGDIGTPGDLDFDADGNLFIADIRSNEVLRVDAKAVVASYADLPDLSSLAFNRDGVLFASTFGDARVYRLADLNDDGDAKDGGEATEFVSFGGFLEGIAFDVEGNLYIADGFVGTITRVPPDIHIGGPTPPPFAGRSTPFSGPMKLAFGQIPDGVSNVDLFSTNRGLGPTSPFANGVARTAVGIAGAYTLPHVCDIDAAPANLIFGAVAVGASDAAEVTLSNLGTANCTVSSVSSDNPDFAVTSPSFPQVITPGSSLSVTVKFQPTAPGGQSGQLTIVSDDPDERNVVLGLLGDIGVGNFVLIDRLTIKLNEGKDQIKLRATLNALASDFDATGEDLVIEIGGLIRSVRLGAPVSDTPKGVRFLVKDATLRLSLDLARKGSSKGSLKMTLKAPLAGIVDPTSPVTINLRNGAFNESTSVAITERKAARLFTADRSSTIRPAIYIEKMSIKQGRTPQEPNAFSLAGGFATKGEDAPAMPENFTLQLGGLKDMVRKWNLPLNKNKAIYKADHLSSALNSGISFLKIDAAKGRFQIKGSGFDLGASFETPLFVELQIGEVAERVFIGLAGKGGSFVY